MFVRRIAALSVLLAVTTAAQADAQTLYVDRGSVGGPCSDARTALQAQDPATPLCSLPRGLKLAPAGATVAVRRGTYPAATVTSVRKAETVTIRGHDGDPAPVLSGLTLPDCRNLHFTALHLRHLEFQRCTDVAITSSEVSGRFLRLISTQRARLVRLDIHHVLDGILMRSVTDVLIAGNRFRNIPSASRTTEGGDGVQGGFWRRVRITGNSFDACRTIPHADTIEAYYDNYDVTIDRNVAHRCRGPIVVPGGTRTTGINRDFVIENNEFTNMKNWGMRLLNMQGARILNNTVWNAGEGITSRGFDTRGIVLVGNITNALQLPPEHLQASEDGTIPAGVEDFNLVAAGDRYGTSSLASAPVFMDPAREDFRLAPGSPGVDGSTTDFGTPAFDRLNNPRSGAAPDIGAYELQQTG